MTRPRTTHANCVAKDQRAVLLLGDAGAGKSDLTLRLLRLGFSLVADDQVVIADGIASPPSELAGLLEVAQVGIVRVPYVAEARLVLIVDLAGPRERMPSRRIDPALNLPVVQIDPFTASAAEKVALAFDCATGAVQQTTGFLTD